MVARSQGIPQKRLMQRLEEVSTSEERREIYKKQAPWFEPIKGLPPELYVPIDTSRLPAQNIRQVLDKMS